MPSVSRDEFDVRSELEAVHLPTGAMFRAYPYIDPDDMLHSIKAQWGKVSTGDYADQIRRVASQLLLERASRAMRDRKMRAA